jgi:hypothetical protein
MIHREMSLWQMPKFPVIESSSEQGKAVDWLDTGIQDLRQLWKRIKGQAKVLGGYDDRTKKQNKRLELLRHRLKRVEMLGYRLQAVRIQAVRRALKAVEEAWFIRSGPGKCYYRGKPVPGIVIRPLTARYHWPRLFNGFSDSMLLMSATVGNFKAFAEELGITEFEE